MRTTLDLDTDVLEAAKCLASRKEISIGKALSEIVRRALRIESATREYTTRNGVPVFASTKDAQIVGPELVERLLNEGE